MKAWIVPAALFAALALSTPAQAAGGCHPKGSHTQARDALVRVFNVGTGLYACRNEGRRVTLQGPSVGWERRPGVHARGANVAFVTENCDEFSCYPALIVMHVRRRSAREMTSAFPTGPTDGENTIRIERFLLAPAAALTWAECQQASDGRFHCAPGGTSQKYISSARARSGTVRLASGTGIDPQSLRLNGDVVSWLDGGQSRSAALR
jgi:hypothetical protein